MPQRGFNYGLMMQRALRSLLVEVLAEVAEHGLPGPHHFFITFDTSHPGVDIADWLKERYPRDMTIVLQEWFADLAVARDRFSVTLNFGDVPEKLVIPFDAIRVFADPSVEFGLKFDQHDTSGDDPDSDGPGDDPPPAAKDPGEGGGDVVQLNRFRKH